METTSLVKDLVKIEGECRSLRNEVMELEKAQRLDQSRTKMLTAAPGLGPNDVGRDKNRSFLIPMDAVDLVNKRAGEVLQLVKEHKKLLREQKKLKEFLLDVSVQAEDAVVENKDLKQHIGHADGKTIFHIKESVENAARVNELKLEIIQALQDRECIKETLRRQTENLKGYVNEFKSTEELNEKHKAAASQLKREKENLETVRKNIYIMQRTLEEKERQLAKEKPVDELEVALSMERDRRVALHKLGKGEEGIRTNEVSIRHRAVQIAKLEKRIEMIGDALARSRRFADGRVDIGQVEDLRNKISVVTGKMNDLESQINELDSKILDLDRRSDGLTRTTQNSRKEMRRILKYHEKTTNMQNEELKEEQMAADEEIREIEREIEMLRRLKQGHKEKLSRR